MTTISLITGVGKETGIGFEVSRQLGALGHTVVLTARRKDSAIKLADRLRAMGHDAHGFELDVKEGAQITALAAEIGSKWGCLDVLINNAAGVSPFGELASTADLIAAEDVMRATLFGAWKVSQTLMPLLLLSSAPRLVNVTSGAGSHGDAAFGLTSGNAMGPAYATAKAALNALTAIQAREAAGSRLLVNAVCPGFTATFPGGEAMGARPVAEGAAGIIWAATLPADGPRGGFFRDGKPLPW
jgi:NAD(P)-dependent dehydrogenase (short-subunit alcohol dehydrogenase family)